MIKYIVCRRVEGIQYNASMKYSSNMESIEALYRKSWKLICNVIIPFPFSSLRSEKRLKDDRKRTPRKKIKVTEELHAIWSEKNTQSFSSFCFYNFKKNHEASNNLSINHFILVLLSLISFFTKLVSYRMPKKVVTAKILLSQIML